MPAELQIRDDLGRDYANRSERRDTKDMPSDDGVVGRVEVDWGCICPITTRVQLSLYAIRN
ncbi:MAG: hypothetical protein O7B24_10665 [Alphaproteobacteria bacterium]|nr:hypothetical protein [Alphaproteobacteria bacterium]